MGRRPPPPLEIRTWTRHSPDEKETYTVSTDPSLIDLDALNAAFKSDLTYWAQPLGRESLALCVERSLCFGVFVSAFGSEGSASVGEDERQDGNPPKTPPTATKQSMIGFARLVTDYTTFAYLTDVYVLEPHQGKGLGKWVLQCLDEVLASWPDLRRCILFTKGEAAVRMYGQAIGARSLAETDMGLVLMERKGPAGASFAGNDTVTTRDVEDK